MPPAFRFHPFQRNVLALSILVAIATTTSAVSCRDGEDRNLVYQVGLMSTGNTDPVVTRDGTTESREMELNAAHSQGNLRLGRQRIARGIGNYGEARHADAIRPLIFLARGLHSPVQRDSKSCSDDDSSVCVAARTTFSF